MQNESDSQLKLIGPFRQIVTMRDLPLKGALKDEALEVIYEGGILINSSQIVAVNSFEVLKKEFSDQLIAIDHVEEDLVALPGFIDAHTHACFAGSRARDYAARNNGKSYLEIAQEGGGIWSTVKHVREADKYDLIDATAKRLDKLLASGITTVEIKSGYGLNIEHELKMLRVINEIKQKHQIDIHATCLAAHIIPKDWEEGEEAYLQLIIDELVPKVKEEKLCHRFDIFIEEGAFSVETAKSYLNTLKERGFQLTVHGDQFHPGGSQVAIDCRAISVDHLEASGDSEIAALSKSDVIPVALPGASIGLGCAFTPARKLLDQGCSLAIASDWNPGSAPQGNLLTQAAILGTFEKLSTAEVFAGITFRAAKVLGLNDRGSLDKNMIADIIAFPTKDYREILYHQGELRVSKVWKKGERL
ncbi:imidazolonepropionase [Flavobacteriaceae bacterium R38]|nr:imidazolonepropionase [Flavobacteriaceae bacterium R38]